MYTGVILINGPSATGKSSVATELHQLCPTSVHISGDALRLFAPIEAKAILGAGSTYRAAATLANFYLQSGASTVIFDYVFESPVQVGHFSGSLNPAIACQMFTLWAPLSMLEARDSTRSEAARQGERVSQSLVAMQPHLSNLGRVIDTSDKSIPEVVQHIKNHLYGIQCLTRHSTGPARKAAQSGEFRR
ncbi:AAA family ATPase [Propionivibrio soli]|uniref:AAA family ATPase n=1 Tax=Propionivibrio soli TaxID=2976531 RepID=UPI0021E92D89|nr:ATP-binding protein [Propionivibrio soli]